MTAIVVESWGSPIFFQERVGIGGRRFRMLKLRSMVPDAESRIRELAHLNESAGPLFKIRRDPRRTRVGRVLRARPMVWLRRAGAGRCSWLGRTDPENGHPDGRLT